MLAVVIDVVSLFLTILDTTNTAADRGLAIIVLTEILWLGNTAFKNCKGTILTLTVFPEPSANGASYSISSDTAHTKILNTIKVSKVLLTKGHPETCTLDSWEVLN